MKALVLAVGCSALALLTGLGVAQAASGQVKLTSLPAQNFAFCLNSSGTLVLSDQASTEVGVIVTNVGNSLTNTSGSIVVAANNYYGKGAGGSWKSGMGQFTLPGGNCYNVASMNKTTGPNGSTVWKCASTSGSPSAAGATMSGLVSTETQLTPIFTGMMMAGVASTLNGAPNINCNP
ncbi:hypothetical protein [Pararhodospirillum photometricum]|uniref:Secreted protein n=1 Tax=Pararhodospirillum photometricum DSM 122 TaxID=1150469 RepID=H6SIU9_PARPM|nr:hypothetical protein [Pararhodospirillum photometricum]CCG06726.1 unnamed protein product [Pararhodospirillum photometricum DSM 122]